MATGSRASRHVNRLCSGKQTLQIIFSRTSCARVGRQNRMRVRPQKRAPHLGLVSVVAAMMRHLEDRRSRTGWGLRVDNREPPHVSSDARLEVSTEQRPVVFTLGPEDDARLIRGGLPHGGTNGRVFGLGSEHSQPVLLEQRIRRCQGVQRQPADSKQQPVLRGPQGPNVSRSRRLQAPHHLARPRREGSADSSLLMGQQKRDHVFAAQRVGAAEAGTGTGGQRRGGTTNVIVVPVGGDYEVDRGGRDPELLEVEQGDRLSACLGNVKGVHDEPPPVARVDDKGFSDAPPEDGDLQDGGAGRVFWA